MNELRWILLAAGFVVLALIYWQGRRKRPVANESRATRDLEPPQLSESAIVRRRDAAPISSQATSVAIDDLPEVRVEPAASRGTSLSMDDALSTAALDRLTLTQPLNPRPDAPPHERPEVVVEEVHAAPRPSVAATAPRSARKIVALRVPAVTSRFNGASLKQAFSNLDLRHGRYGIYHRPDPKGVPIFSVASIVEPGTFEPTTMSNQDFPGVSLFMQLPGPVDGVAAFDAMLACARTLQSEFGGGLQAERGKALTDVAIEKMREDIANFQHLTSASTGV